MFGGWPDEAWAAWQRLPVGTLEGILEYRAYRQAKGQYEAATTPEAQQALRGDPWVDRVRAFEFAQAAKKLKAAREKKG